MDNPLVVAIMLTADRQEMTDRAVRSFRSQHYENKCLVVWDNGTVPYRPPGVEWREFFWTGERKEIGPLRNDAIRFALDGPSPTPDLIAHMDADDWSSPFRFSEQVALLQSTNSDCVGYRDALFWDTRGPGEAWVHSDDFPGNMLGASMVYRASAWKQRPFMPTSQGEDHNWFVFVKRATAPSIPPLGPDDTAEPRMVCAIHGQNSSNAYHPDLMSRCEWRKEPRWSEYCRRTMRLDVPVLG